MRARWIPKAAVSGGKSRGVRRPRNERRQMARKSREGQTYSSAVVAVVYGPPLADHLIVGAAVRGAASLGPGLVGADEVDHGDVGLEVAVGREVLVVSRRGDVVGKRQAMVGVRKVHVQETLVGTVKGDAALGQGGQGAVLADIGGEHHDAGVEQIGPANVRGGGKGVGEVKELIGGAVGDDVGVDVDDLAELGLLPEVDLGEGRVEIGAVHEVEVGGRGVIRDARDGYDVVVDILRVLGAGTGGQGEAQGAERSAP